jgi:hypothetical protein
LALWVRPFYFYVLSVILQKLLEKLPTDICIWGTLHKAIFPPDVLLGHTK